MLANNLILYAIQSRLDHGRRLPQFLCTLFSETGSLTHLEFSSELGRAAGPEPRP